MPLDLRPHGAGRVRGKAACPQIHPLTSRGGWHGPWTQEQPGLVSIIPPSSSELACGPPKGTAGPGKPQDSASLGEGGRRMQEPRAPTHTTV